MNNRDLHDARTLSRAAVARKPRINRAAPAGLAPPHPCFDP